MILRAPWFRGLACVAGFLLFAACDLPKAPGDTLAGEGETGGSPDTDPHDSGLIEACDGVDNDADGLVDEGFPDADTNGRVDCLDVECPPLEVGGDDDVSIVSACEGRAVGTGADPWNVVVEYRHEKPALERGGVRRERRRGLLHLRLRRRRGLRGGVRR